MNAFELKSPASTEEAISELQRYGDEAKLIAGGTALVIMMMQRLIQPTCLISLQRLRELDRIEARNGHVHLGALATHREVETSSVVSERIPALAETFRHVATLRIRNVATVGGSLAHADPNQDPPVTLLALGARAEITGPGGTREVPLEEFFVDYYQTVLRLDELLTGVAVPVPPSRTGSAFLKFLPRTVDDYATVSVAAALTLGADGQAVHEVRIALGSVGSTPLRARPAEDLLRGHRLSDALVEAAGEAVRGIVDPVDDHRGSAEYKREMAVVFVQRAIRKAGERAGAR